MTKHQCNANSVRLSNSTTERVGQQQHTQHLIDKTRKTKTTTKSRTIKQVKSRDLYLIILSIKSFIVSLFLFIITLILGPFVLKIHGSGVTWLLQSLPENMYT